MVTSTPTSNIFQQQNFRLSFLRLPGIVLNCQKVRIPGVTSGPAMMNTPFRQIAFEGDQIRDDGPLSIQFRLDENLQAYLEVFNWMKGIRPLEDVIENSIPYESRRSDITLSILDSALGPNINVFFEGAFPTSIGGFDLDSTLNSVEPLLIDADFAYVQHKFETL